MNSQWARLFGMSDAYFLRESTASEIRCQFTEKVGNLINIKFLEED